MAGLVPAIFVFSVAPGAQDVDARDKRGMTVERCSEQLQPRRQRQTAGEVLHFLLQQGFGLASRVGVSVMRCGLPLTTKIAVPLKPAVLTPLSP